MQESRRYRTGNSRQVGDRVDDLLIRLSSGEAESNATVDEYFDTWFESRRTDLAASTLYSYGLTHRHYISPYLGSMPLRELNVPRIAAWLSNLLTVGGRRGPLSVSTVRYARVLLHKALEDAVNTGELLVNPVARTQAPVRDVNGQRKRFPASSWTLDELRTFLNASGDHRYAPLFSLLATTGMRRGEALGLTWGNVDLSRCEVVIERSLTVIEGVAHLGVPKSGRTRRIALGDRALDALGMQEVRQRSVRLRQQVTWRNDRDLVFTAADGSHLSPDSASSAFRALVTKVAVPRIRLHDLRHTHAILLLHAGVPVIDVSHRLGHADPGVTLALYAQALQNPGHAVAETFDRLLDDSRWSTEHLAGSAPGRLDR